MVQNIILTVGRSKGKLVLDNNNGQSWKMSGVDAETAVAALVFFTLKGRFEQLSCFSDNFEIELTIKQTTFSPEL